jgi:hypothetical protein
MAQMVAAAVSVVLGLAAIPGQFCCVRVSMAQMVAAAVSVVLGLAAIADAFGPYLSTSLAWFEVIAVQRL